MVQPQAQKQLIDALRSPVEGRLYDLDPGRFPGMPLWAGHPPFQVVSYRTPQGVRTQGDQEWLAAPHNQVGVALMSELVIAGMHSGAHIDALAHITCGEDNHWHGGYTTGEWLGDFGPMRDDASTIEPIIARGVLVDLAAHLQVSRCQWPHKSRHWWPSCACSLEGRWASSCSLKNKFSLSRHGLRVGGAWGTVGRFSTNGDH